MVLDLYQYIWLYLHEKGYDYVYFLQEEENRFSISDFGEQQIKRFSYVGDRPKYFRNVRKLFSKGDSYDFCKWFWEKMVSQHRKKCAFVSMLNDFCSVFQDTKWQEALGQTKAQLNQQITGTLVLISPPIVEYSHMLLLESPVFSVLGIREIVNARAENHEIQDYYASLKSDMGKSCIFLNTFSYESVRTLLMHMVFNMEERFDDIKELELMARYLVQYLNNRQLQWQDCLFDRDVDLENLFYKDLYSQLSKDTVWKQLQRIIKKVRVTGSVRAYVTQKGIPYYESIDAARMSYEKSSDLWKCMRIAPQNISGNLDTLSNKECVKMLMEIHKELGHPSNYQLNVSIVSEIGEFIRQLENACTNMDIGTYQRALFSIQFCAKFVYTSSDASDALERIIEALHSYVEQSMIVFRCKCAVQGIDSHIYKSASDRIIVNCIAQEKVLESYEKGVRTSIANFSMPDFNPDRIKRISEDMDRMVQDIKAANEQQEKTASSATEAVASKEEEIEDFDFVITPEMKDCHPPK